jgi:hypothetical protein
LSYGERERVTRFGALATETYGPSRATGRSLRDWPRRFSERRVSGNGRPPNQDTMEVTELARPIYRFAARRDGKWWVALGDGAQGAEEITGPLTQGRSLDELQRMIRDAISLMREVPEDSFEVVMEVDLPAPLAKAAEEARDSREVAELAQRDATSATARAVARMREAGYGLRDVGRVLGISYQRAAQIEQEVGRPSAASTRGDPGTRRSASGSARPPARV